MVKKKNEKMVPKLRFPGFTDPWEQRKLGEVGKARSGIGFPDAEQGGGEGIPFFKVSDMNTAGNENEMTTANNYVTEAQIASHRWHPITEVPALFFAKVGAAVMLNRKRLCRFPFLLDNNTMAYSLDKDSWDADFSKALFETVDLTSLIQVGALPSYNTGDVENMKIYLPSLSEQRIIGTLFKQLDNLITLHQRECELLELQKKGAMQKIFSQEVRFRREDGTEYPVWRYLPMDKVFTEIIDKNHPDLPVLSIQQGIGTTLRDKTNRKIEYDNKNLPGYKAMRPGDFIIHLRTFEGGLECANHEGISSPAYRILRSNIINSTVYRYYFRSYDFIVGKLSVAVVGIRDGKSIDMDTFWQIIIPVPCPEEQRKIAAFLSTFDKAIDLAKEELEQYKLLKKGLMQRMFV